MEVVTSILTNKKQQYKDLMKESEKQKELLEKELRVIERENSEKVKKLDERVKESSAALESSKKKHEEERLAKEKEIENERLNSARELKELEESFSRRRAELGSQSKEELREMQTENKKERDELMAAQRNALELMKKERDDLRAAHKEKLKAAEEEHRQIIQERKDRLNEHTKEIAQVKEDHNKRYFKEKEELFKIRKEVLEEQSMMIKREAELKMQACDDGLKRQMMSMNDQNQTQLANSFSRMLHLFTAAMEACQQLRDNFAELANDAEMGLFLICKCSIDWTDANNRTKNAAHYLRDMINGFNTVSSTLRNEVTDAMIAIEKTIIDKQSLIMAIDRNVFNKQIMELQLLQPQIDNHLNHLKQMKEIAEKICTPHSGNILMTACLNSPHSSAGMIKS